MRSVFDFVVKPKGSRTSSKKDLDGKELILNTDLQDHRYVNRVGTVIGAPLRDCGGVIPGDDVIVHHNVFRRFYDVRGTEKNSRSFFAEDTYFCKEDQVFAYKRGSEWKALDGYCFVKPLESDDMWTTEKELPNIGVLKMLGDDLQAQGLQQGDVVGFTPRSEYEFVIDGERLYRVLSAAITINYGHKGDKKEYNPSWS
jgi:hypothetical protein